MRTGDLRHARLIGVIAPFSVAPAQLVCRKALLGLQYHNY